MFMNAVYLASLRVLVSAGVYISNEAYMEVGLLNYVIWVSTDHAADCGKLNTKIWIYNWRTWLFSGPELGHRDEISLLLWFRRG